jgi:3-oxoadipate enol-lactonase
MGGMIAQTFQLKYPGIFKTMTLADTTSRYPAELQSTWQARIDTASSKGMEPIVQPTLERWFTEPYRKSGAPVVGRIAEAIRATPVPGFVGCCHAIPKINVSARLKEVKIPSLVIVGEQDPGTPVSMAQEIHENLPGSELVIIPSAAHLSNLEQPEAFNKALAGVLERHG